MKPFLTKKLHFERYHHLRFTQTKLDQLLKVFLTFQIRQILSEYSWIFLNRNSIRHQEPILLAVSTRSLNFSRQDFSRLLQIFDNLIACWLEDQIRSREILDYSFFEPLKRLKIHFIILPSALSSALCSFHTVCIWKALRSRCRRNLKHFSRYHLGARLFGLRAAQIILHWKIGKALVSSCRFWALRLGKHFSDEKLSSSYHKASEHI